MADFILVLSVSVFSGIMLIAMLVNFYSSWISRPVRLKQENTSGLALDHDLGPNVEILSRQFKKIVS